METLLSFIFASIALTFAPGPDILLVLNESITKGVKSGMTIAAGLVCGLPFHTLVLVLGWEKFIDIYPNLIFMLKITGALYFMLLAYKAFKNIAFKIEPNSLLEKDYLMIFKKGMIMNLLNPKVTLFFWLFFPGFLFDSTLTNSKQYAILGTIFTFQAFLVFSFVSITASKIASLIFENVRILYWMNFVQVIFLMCIALYLLF
tara:strand:- start:1385 stop:1993 length:609 start_codon:yes stop_codon:yes gene_type:complete